MPKTIIDGIFTGALTSVPALAAALEIKHTATTSVIFGLVYPFGIVATVLFIRVLPVLFRVDLQKEVEAYEAAQKTRFPDIHTRNFRITNENFKNTEIKKSKIVIEFKLSKIINRLEKYPIKKQKESIRLKLGLISLEDYIHFYKEYTNLEIEKITLEKELKIKLINYKV